MSDHHTTVMPNRVNGAAEPADPAPVPLLPLDDEPAGVVPSPVRRTARPRRGRGGLSGLSGLTSQPGAAVWGGLAVVAFGFLVILFSWIKVAATLDVGRQMPYVVSGAMTGLGLIVVGIGVVDMAVRRQDRLERRQQLNLMRTLLEDVRDVLEPERRD